MFAKTNSCDVKGGRVHVTCKRCKKTRYFEVLQNDRKRTLRCSCGKSESYTLNHRRFNRESASGVAQVILNGGRESKVMLCDMSYGGVGFLMKRQYARSLKVSSETVIRFRASSGAMTQRKIRIQSIDNNRVGGQYTDGCSWLMDS